MIEHDADGDSRQQSNGKNGEGLVFHYDRERRLQRAPEGVKRAYEEGYTPNKGFIRGLTANAGLKSIFVTIIILSVTAVALTLLGGQNGKIALGELDVRVRAFSYGDSVYVSVLIPENDQYGGDSAQVSAIIHGLSKTDVTVSEKELTGIYTGSELLLRCIVPDHDIDRIVSTVNIDELSGKTVVSVDRE